MASPAKTPHTATTDHQVGAAATLRPVPACLRCAGGAPPVDGLVSILRQLPGETPLPASWLLERLEGGPAAVVSDAATAAVTSPAVGTGRRFLSTEEYGRQRVPERSADWVRRQCAQGLLHGAYKDSGQWVIPADAARSTVEPASDSQSALKTSPTRSRREVSPARRSKRQTASAERYPRW